MTTFFILASFTMNAIALERPEMGVSPISINKSIVSASLISLEYQLTIDDWQSLFEGDNFIQITRWVAVAEGEHISISVMDDADKTIVNLEQNFQQNIPVDQNNNFHIGKKWTSNGVDFYPIIFNPLKYDPSISKFTLTKSAEIEISLPDTPPPMHRLSNSARSMWGEMLLNNHPPLRDEHGDGGGYVYVVPADDDVLEIMEDLIEWRRLQGFNVIVYILPDRLEGGISGDQLAANLIDMHNEGQPIEYICLVGDTGGEFIVPTTIHGTSDYHFSLLEGDDPLPDAAVGRLSYNSFGELRRMVTKILNYEREPDIGNMGWLRRGAVIAGNEISGISTILVSKWARNQMLSHGYTNVDTLWYTMGNSVEESFRRSINSGVSYISYRGWTGLEDFTPREAGRLANRSLPVALLLGCSTGNYSGRGAGYTEALLRAEGGAIGAIGNATLQSRVNYNNALMAGFFKAVLDDGAYRLGWILNRAKLELFATYGAVGRENVISHAYWTNLMGDPATIIWTGIPRQVEIEIADVVMIGSDPIEVSVTHNNVALAGARVGLYKVDEFIAAGYTDEDGIVRFSYPPLEISAGEGFFTVTGDRILPITTEFNFIQPQELLVFDRSDINDFENGLDLEGNADGIMQPFEVLYLHVRVENAGTNMVNGPLIMTLSTEHQAIDILEPEFVFQENVQVGEGTTARFMIGANGLLPDQEEIQFVLTVNTEDNEWIMPFTTSGGAPRIKFHGLTPPDLRIERGIDASFDIIIMNQGSVSMDQSVGTLISLSELAEVIDDQGEYEAIQIGESVGAGEVFIVSVDEDIPWGTVLPFRLNMESELGIIQDVEFDILVQSNPNDFPTGPDDFGYWAIDNFDEDSNISPRYNWTEINPELNGPGENTGLLDQGEDDDKSIVLRLPFEFQYYGENYNLLTVCTNGWAAFGAQADYIDFRNLSIGTPQGPDAQLCPWWDDLYQPRVDGGVFYWYDTEQHRFIVEWYQMSRYVGPSGPGAEETFQLILHDPDWHPTYTGDGDIIFQYQSVTNSARIDVHGTPYATVGIGNLDDSGGLEYSFWDRFAYGANPIDRQTVIKFSTSPNHNYGFVSGNVVSRANNAPIVGAIVRASTGGWVITDENGSYDSLSVLANLPFNLTATRIGFNDEISGNLEVDGARNQQVNFQLPNPLISLNVQEIADTLEFNQELEHFFNIVNDGNGDLNFQINFSWLVGDQGISGGQNYPIEPHRDDPDELWERLFGWNVTEFTGDNRIMGAVFHDEAFFVSGGANGDQNNLIYIFDRNGNENGRIWQPCNGIWGFRDLAYREGNIYGSCDDQIYVIDINGQFIDSFESPLVPATAIAAEPNGNLWVANDGEPLHHLDPVGNIIGLYQHRLRPYGLAWHPAEVDGYPLYIFSADGETNMAISKMNPETGDIIPVTVLEMEAGDRAGGCEFTMDWDTRRWTLITVVQNPDGDRVELFDAGPNISWINAIPASGQVLGEQEVEITLIMSAENLDRGEYQLDMIVSHNALGDDIHIPIILSVEPQFVSVRETGPVQFSLNSIFPNPANSSTRIDFSLSRQASVKLSVWDNQGRKVADLYDMTFMSGNHSLPFNGIGLPSGIYILKFEAGGLHNSRKFVLLK